MKEVNNFKKLMEEDEETYLRVHDRRVRSSVWGTLGFFRLIGDLVGMFLPQVVDVFVMAAGGRSQDPPAAPRPPSQGPPPDGPGKKGPGTPDDEDDLRR